MQSVKTDVPAPELSSAGMEIHRDRFALASLLDPLNAGYRTALARAKISLGSPGIGQYKKAIAYLPTDARVLQKAARAFEIDGDSSTADALMRASMLYGARHHDIYLYYASWLLYRGHYKDAEAVTRNGVSIEPRRTVKYVRMMSDMGLSGPEILSAIPALTHLREVRISI